MDPSKLRRLDRQQWRHPFDLRDRSLNYTWSDFDRRHVFQGTYTYGLPFGKGKKFGKDMNAVANAIVEESIRLGLA